MKPDRYCSVRSASADTFRVGRIQYHSSAPQAYGSVNTLRTSWFDRSGIPTPSRPKRPNSSGAVWRTLGEGRFAVWITTQAQEADSTVALKRDGTASISPSIVPASIVRVRLLVSPRRMAYNFSEVRLDSPVADVESIANFRAFPLLLESTLMGVFTVQTAFLVQHQCHRLMTSSTLPAYLRSRPKPHTRLLLGLTVCLYLLAVACWALDIVLLRQDLLDLLPNQLSTDPDPGVYATLAQLRGEEQYAQAVLQIVIWLISDCITLWRAYAVLGKPRWLRYTIFILLFLEFADYVVYIVLYVYIFPHPPRFISSLYQSSGGLIGTAPFAATSAFTAAVQAFASFLIFCKAWMILKSRQGLPCGPGRTFRTLSVFIESGLAYSVLWIWYAIGSNDEISSQMTSAWMDSYVIPLTAMYPTLVMMIVTIQDSALAKADRLSSRPDERGDQSTSNLHGSLTVAKPRSWESTDVASNVAYHPARVPPLDALHYDYPFSMFTTLSHSLYRYAASSLAGNPRYPPMNWFATEQFIRLLS
ncbi:unnamed protein product [Peniophora sp. CBMAI 1063]|nr:unnamed protein product [Peniophora sp. CBMAI 1063]